MHEKEYLLQKKDNVQLKNEGTYGNGSIDWGARGLYLYDIAQQVGIECAIAANVNHELCPMDTFIKQNCKVDFITLADNEGEKILMRTGEFLLAYGAKKVYGSELQKVGNYVDRQRIIYTEFVLSETKNISETELTAIRQNIEDILCSDKTIQRKILPYYAAMRKLKDVNEHYLMEQIDEQDDGGPVLVNVLGGYFALNTGLLLPDLHLIKELKLLRVERTAMRCRIYAEIVI